MKSITFLFPGFYFNPVGGVIVPLEYANRLAKDVFQVHVVYADTMRPGTLPWQLQIRWWLRRRAIKLGLLQRSVSKWFKLHPTVCEHFVFTLDYKNVPHTDLYVCTSIDTSPYLRDYPIAEERKFYFIQGYEAWGRSDEEVRATYHYPMQRIVISEWLRQIVSVEEGLCCSLVRNGFDESRFHLIKPIEEKKPMEISMLYHLSSLKDCATSMAALNIVKDKYPQLHVTVFGTPVRPADMPDWYTYYQSPSQEEHLRINNESAIYVAASIEEGWGLTVGEAMLCGQAVACTNNRGFREMAIDGETALLSPIKDAEALASNICRLIEDDNLRFRLAQNGMRYIGKMTMEKSYSEFKKALGLSQ